MNNEQINSKLLVIFNDILEVKEFKSSLTMDEVHGWDSMKHIQLLSAIQDTFGIEIQFEDALEMISVKSIIRKIKESIAINKDND